MFFRRVFIYGSSLHCYVMLVSLICMLLYRFLVFCSSKLLFLLYHGSKVLIAILFKAEVSYYIPLNCSTEFHEFKSGVIVGC